MDRRRFLQTTIAAGIAGAATGAPRPVLAGAGLTGQAPALPPLQQFDGHSPLVVERRQEGKPRAGQVVVAIQPHSDDIPLFAAGTVFKLLDEGATGYVIRVTNDDMAGPGIACRNGDGQLAQLGGRRQGARRRAHLRPQLQQPHDGQHRVGGVASALHLPVPHAEGRHRGDLRPLGRLRGESRSRRHQPLRRSGRVDGRRHKDYPEHFAAGLDAARRDEKYYFARFQQRSTGSSTSARGSKRRSTPTSRTRRKDRPARTASGCGHDWQQRDDGCRCSAPTIGRPIGSTSGSSCSTATAAPVLPTG